ncbi:hypothetical protein HYPSUDRAFT_34028 [Hypholoma sublateritium FD-334 SS-4]|uniref:CENP-V/GFA domain-containing protein n=1 Tax=Hypholoma sublateritium (strain FD-334 SS-4) TaxID=945553 RepID=A0A0D2PJK1_HYPSF|nr:hypothetical protein HYPSUDRAFT_34028 [Hypholoma sublateritium FD-334 SS-4]
MPTDSESDRFSPSVDVDVVHRGGCFCGSVSYEVKGLPSLSAYCHCSLCQRLNAAAFIVTCHFPAPQFTWTQNTQHIDELIESYAVASKPWKIRWRCKKCGCTVASNNIKAKTWSVWGAQLERNDKGRIIGWDTIKPTAHIFYDTRLADVADDLSKWNGYEGKSERLG